MHEMESWCCAMVKDGPGIIPVNVRLHLQYSACDLVLKKQERMKILSMGRATASLRPSSRASVSAQKVE
jgi:hypothetical protein